MKTRKTATKTKQPAQPFANVRTLADLGMTPARAWALHHVTHSADNHREERWPSYHDLTALSVRVLHESLDLTVLLVLEDNQKGLNGTSASRGELFSVRMVPHERYGAWPEARWIAQVDDDGTLACDQLEMIGCRWTGYDQESPAARKGAA